MKRFFWKMSGAGNDFVLLAGAPPGRSGAALARKLCDRRRGIGADGLLALSRRGARVRLDYWNADGSSAFCGNGSRCAALWAAGQGWVKGPRFTLETNRGALDIGLTGSERAEVAMPRPRGLRLHRKLKVLSRPLTVHSVDTGVPHAVVFVPDAGAVDVQRLGRALRRHKIFGKSGANVDFTSLQNNILLIRTYERGVEGETLACGTGVVASAVVAHALGKIGARVKVRVRGGETLTVSIGKKIWLEGPGKITFTGEIAL